MRKRKWFRSQVERIKETGDWAEPDEYFWMFPLWLFAQFSTIGVFGEMAPWYVIGIPTWIYLVFAIKWTKQKMNFYSGRSICPICGEDHSKGDCE